MKLFGFLGNSFWLLLYFQLAIVQNAIAIPLSLSAKSDSVNNLDSTSIPADPNLVGQRRNKPVLRRTKVKPIAPPTQVTTPPAPPEISPSDSSDWASTALQSLAERYGCEIPTIAGNQPMSRSQFAASLNSCILKMEESIATKAVTPLKEDLATIESLQQEFASELATLIIRIDEKADKSKQFSTTTKLVGEVVFAVADTFGNRTTTTGDPTVPVFGYRARLNFDTSFSGQDLLRIRLQARDVPVFSSSATTGAPTGTNMTRLGFDGQGGAAVGLHDFYYRFPLGANTTATLIANEHGSDNLAPNLSLLSSSGRGALSRLARYSPIYRLVDGPGVAVRHKFSDEIDLSLAYRVRNGTNANPGNGLFNGNYGILSQLTVKPFTNFDIGLQYVNAYNPAGGANVAGGTGSDFAQTPFTANTATQTNTYGAVASYRFSPEFLISGWAGFTEATGQSGTDIGKRASLSNWMVTLAFPDLGQKGNIGSLSVGMPPRVNSNDNAARLDPGTSLHIEALYRHQLNENFAITPGFFVITNPNHNSANQTQVVGVVRTTLSF
jgi:hypothetical protein